MRPFNEHTGGGGRASIERNDIFAGTNFFYASNNSYCLLLAAILLLVKQSSDYLYIINFNP